MAVAVGLGSYATPAWESTRRDVAAPSPAHHPSHATQTNARAAVRTAHLRWSGNRVEDTAAEACERHDTSTWAAKLGVPPDAKLVARALAKRYYEPATTQAAYEGCLGTLEER